MLYCFRETGEHPRRRWIMVEMKRILFFTDFSAEATDALGYAREFAEKFGARLYLLHVIEDPTSKLYGMVSGDYHALDRNAYEKTQEWLPPPHREQMRGSPDREALIEGGGVFLHVPKVVHDKHNPGIVLCARAPKSFPPQLSP